MCAISSYISNLLTLSLTRRCNHTHCCYHVRTCYFDKIYLIKATITSKEAHVRASKARIVTRDTGQYLINKKNTKVKEDVKSIYT